MSEVLLLEGVYLHLVRNGVPIAVREYQDALTALAGGHGGLERARLRWLCETLWCRTERESILLDQLFRSLPTPDPELVRELLPETLARNEATPVRRGEQDRDVRVPPPASSPTPIQFAAPTQSGSGLPSVQFPPSAERFILTPRPIVSLRSLIVVWRRFRRAQRSGPKVELDIHATVAEQGRRGRIAEPVLVPARRNQARLVVLVDVSPSMAPWRRWNAMLGESLRASQLADAPLFYFDNVPGDTVYERDSLTHRMSLRDVWLRHPAAVLMVVSDAGAARERVDRGRIATSQKFLRYVQEHWSPVAWINPMPASRWKTSSSSRIARVPGCRMFELTEDGLVAAVDFLRGKVSGAW